MASTVTDRRPPRRPLRARQVNLLLEVAILTALATGLVSWTVGTGWGRWLTIAHAVAGLSILVLAPAKTRTSVRAGLRRRRPSAALSIAFSALVLVTVLLGILHSTGLWFGVGQWSALWTHVLAGVALVPLFLWHLVTRPVTPRSTDLDRRLVVGGTTAVAGAAALLAGQEMAVRVLSLAGGERRFTGSHEVGSFDPSRLPTVSWINDEAPPDTDPGRWRLEVFGTVTSIDDLAGMAVPLTAALDCTGGWWSNQAWDAVPLAALAGNGHARSITVVSATGFSRRFPSSDLGRLWLAVGYSGLPLRRGHGAPVRLVAPGRRGPWWVKWVVRVDFDHRPAWLQLPFPLT